MTDWPLIVSHLKVFNDWLAALKWWRMNKWMKDTILSLQMISECEKGADVEVAFIEKELSSSWQPDQ